MGGRLETLLLDLLILIGAAGVVRGVYMASPAAGWIAAGIVVILAAFLFGPAEQDEGRR